MATTRSCKTIILGSGAAGLAAALRLNEFGARDVVAISEGLNQGASINTGSDKQTYYKLGLCGSTPDSPRALAETYAVAGGADGDLALTEAANSTRAFMRLVELGVPFPCDAYGQYAGYKTDHDPCKRATSCGPYTSREMCRALIRELKRRDVEILEDRVAVKLLAVDEESASAERETPAPKRRIVGMIVANRKTRELEVYRAENVVFAVGGPGGLYERSVYPECHTGAIGLALEIGALAKGLPESQFGLASFTSLAGRSVDPKIENAPKEFRWNVSGTYMQALPRFISTEADGETDSREFLPNYFSNPVEALNRVFLKGYQWPFDARKALDGSSFIDLCVFYETSILGRRVFLDYRDDPVGLDFDSLDPEARRYLANSDALASKPFERLRRMNPGAIALYRDFGVDLEIEPLEIAVCAQHNNGGLAVDSRYRSTNIAGLYAIGEVAGVHGVARPGGSALNSGQVGALRAAEAIVRAPARDGVSDALFDAAVAEGMADLERVLTTARTANLNPRVERAEFQRRMTLAAGLFRSRESLERARIDANAQLARLKTETRAVDALARPDDDAIETLRNWQLCFAHRVYLEAVYRETCAGVGSRGSQLTLDPNGARISEKFPDDWRVAPENEEFRLSAFYAFCPPGAYDDPQTFVAPVRPIPEPNEWFETVWREYREGKIYE